eukprot:1452642-Prymnesium_polylepis.2
MPRPLARQHERRHQPKPTQPTSDQRAPERLLNHSATPARRLGNHHTLSAQNTLTSGAEEAWQARFTQQPLPLLRRQQRAELTRPLRITEQPPAVCHAKRDLHNRKSFHSFVHDRQARRPQQQTTVPQRVVHVGCRVQHVHRQQQLERVRRKPLQPWVGVDVEHRILHKGVHAKPTLCLPQERPRHVGEHVPRTVAVQLRQHHCSCAARPCAHLERMHTRVHRRNHTRVVQPSEQPPLVHRPQQIERAAGEEHARRVDLTTQHTLQLRPTVRNQLHLSRHLRVLSAQRLRRHALAAGRGTLTAPRQQLLEVRRRHLALVERTPRCMRILVAKLLHLVVVLARSAPRPPPPAPRTSRCRRSAPRGRASAPSQRRAAAPPLAHASRSVASRSRCPPPAPCHPAVPAAAADAPNPHPSRPHRHSRAATRASPAARCVTDPTVLRVLAFEACPDG